MKNKKTYFIVLCGVDGAGKTYTGKKMQQHTDCYFFQSPEGFWKKYRHIPDGSHFLVSFCWYFVSNWILSFKISLRLRKKSVICDRYLHSTWAYHIIWGFKLLRSIPVGCIPIRKPDLVYYLYSTKQEREKRILQRKINSKRDLDFEELEKAHREFMRFAQLIKIDTTNMSKEEMFKTVINDIKKRTTAN